MPKNDWPLARALPASSPSKKQNTFLALPNGIPSHDTFKRVLTLLKPSEFQRGFQNWLTSVVELVAGEVVAIDGKVLRRSHARSRAQQAINLVSAWASAKRLT